MLICGLKSRANEIQNNVLFKQYLFTVYYSSGCTKINPVQGYLINVFPQLFFSV